MNYCGFNIAPFCSDVCGDYRRPQTLAEICKNMGICCGFRAMAARVKYPGFMQLHEEDAQLYPDAATDPDVKFFNEISHQSKINSKYHLRESFFKYIAHVKDQRYECISMMHMNISSIKANIDSFAAYLDTLQFTFKLISLTEIRLDKNIQDLYSIPGYNMISNFRQESQATFTHARSGCGAEAGGF